MKSFIVQPFAQKIGVTSDPKAFIEWWNKYNANVDKMDLKELGRCQGMAAALDDRPKLPQYVIYMPVDFTVTAVFHEALHMAHFVMERCMAPINAESTETQAYLMEHIAEKVMEKLK